MGLKRFLIDKLDEFVILWNYNTNGNRKSPVICATQLAGGSLLKKLKYFEIMLNILNSRECEKMLNLDCSMQIRFFLNCPTIFLK